MQLGDRRGALLDAVFELVEDGLVLFDAFGTRLRANRAYLDSVDAAPLAFDGLLADGDKLLDRCFSSRAPTLREPFRRTWQASAIAVELQDGKPALLVTMRRKATGLPDLSPRDARTEESWHRISRSSIELAALGRALEDLPIGVALVESEAERTGILARNRAYSEQLGLDPAGEACLETVLTFAADQATRLPDDARAGLVAARSGVVVRNQEVRVNRGDDDWRILHVSAAPVPTRDGTKRALEVMFDVTDEVRAREQGAVTRARYSTVFASCSDQLLVAQVDPQRGDFIVREANEPMLAALGSVREDVVGRPLLQVVPSYAVLHETLVDVMSGGFEPRCTELELDGRHYALRVFRVSSTEVAVSTVETTPTKLAEREATLLAERHARTAETVPGLLYDYRVQADGRVVFEYVSPQAEQVLGVDAASLMRDPDLLWSRIGTHDREVLFRGHRRVEGGVEDVLFVTPEIQPRYVRFSWASAEVQVGIGRSGSGFVFDVTDSVNARSQLLRSRHELFELLAKLPLGVFVAREGKVVFANAVFAALAGRASPLALLGVPVSELFGRAAADLEVRLEGEAKVVRPDGTVVELEVSARREVELDGLKSLLWTVRDLTELRTMRARLVQADRLASVGMLAAGVAHEINNPLAYLIAALDYLRESSPDLPSAGQAALAEAWEGANRVRQVVRDLKCFSKPDIGRKAPVDVHALLDSAANMSAHELRSRARLTKEYGGLPSVLGNESRLAQVFLNLIVNAAQAIAEGSVEANSVTIRTSTDLGGRAVIEIEDTGEGISEGQLARVFEPFFSTKVERGGTGLGLAICKTTVEAMGGRIEVESRVGEGTTVRVRLPAAASPGVVACKTERAPALPCPRRGRVLVVDDEPAIAQNLKRLIERDHDVVVHTDSRRALALLAAGERFDLILCDLMMPGLSGMEFADRLRGIDVAAADTLVFLTGGAFTADANAFLRSHHYLEKPFDPAAIRSLVSDRVRRMSVAV